MATQGWELLHTAFLSLSVSLTLWTHWAHTCLRSHLRPLHFLFPLPGVLILQLLAWLLPPYSALVEEHLDQQGTKTLTPFLTTLLRVASLPLLRVPHCCLFHSFTEMHTLVITRWWLSAQGLLGSMYSERSRPVVVNHGQFLPPRNTWQCLETFLSQPRVENCASGIWWVRVKKTTKHLTVHRTAHLNKEGIIQAKCQ